MRAKPRVGLVASESALLRSRDPARGAVVAGYRVMAAFAAIVAGAAAGCAARTSEPRGTFAGRLVASSDYAAGGASPVTGGFGADAKPQEGKPLALERCLSLAEMTDAFGRTCTHVDPEATPAAEVGEGLHTGAPPVTRIVQWYCDTRTVIRVVLEPCAGGNFKPRQIAFTRLVGSR